MTSNKLSLKSISSNLFVYGITHALIDLICAGVIFSIWKFQLVDARVFFYLVILYNILAFGFQSLFGIITDYIKKPREIAFLGCLFTGISSIVFLSFPVTAIILAGLGNALFHVGGGSISLNLTPNKASAPGIYVAPGAMGLFVGTFLGKGGNFNILPFIIALVIFGLLMFVIKKPEIDYNKKEKEMLKLNYFGIILFFILFSVAIRSFIGLSISFPWKTDFNLLIILISAIVLGKGFGGIIADKFGWIRISVGALVLSIPFLLLGSNYSILGIIGMFLFNITMPVTLVAISNILPGRPAFAFGLTCFALLLGALPVLLGIKVSSFLLIFLIIVISSIVLYYGLKLLYKNKDFRYNMKK